MDAKHALIYIEGHTFIKKKNWKLQRVIQFGFDLHEKNAHSSHAKLLWNDYYC